LILKQRRRNYDLDLAKKLILILALQGEIVTVRAFQYLQDQDFLCVSVSLWLN